MFENNIVVLAWIWFKSENGYGATVKMTVKHFNIYIENEKTERNKFGLSINLSSYKYLNKHLYCILCINCQSKMQKQGRPKLLPLYINTNKKFKENTPHLYCQIYFRPLPLQ